MALTIGGGTGGGGGGGGVLYTNSTRRISSSQLYLRRHIILIPTAGFHPSSPRIPFHIVAASKKGGSRTGRFDSKNRRGSTTTTKDQDQEEEEEQQLTSTAQIETDGITDLSEVDDDGFVMPELPGLKTDFWEGPQWDAFGFFIQYLWAFGILFALISSGIAVATYNEGATDFKKTPVYQEAIQSRDLLEEPEASSSDVFESNPTEEAPSLE